MNDLIALVIAVAVCLAAAGVGAYATVRSLRDWYIALPKPSWNPPNAVFGPVWTLLVLNVLWSVSFFGLRSPLAGLVVIVLLLGAILATIFAFAPISLLAAAILVPYLAWVTFATALNAAIVMKGRALRSS